VTAGFVCVCVGALCPVTSCLSVTVCFLPVRVSDAAVRLEARGAADAIPRRPIRHRRTRAAARSQETQEQQRGAHCPDACMHRRGRIRAPPRSYALFHHPTLQLVSRVPLEQEYGSFLVSMNLTLPMGPPPPGVFRRFHSNPQLLKPVLWQQRRKQRMHAARRALHLFQCLRRGHPYRRGHR
jgi:hypothetical protein